MDKKLLILITAIIIIVLVLIALFYFFFLKQEKKPIDTGVVEQRLENISVELDSISSKSFELRELASEAGVKLNEAGETEKAQTCQQTIILLDEIFQKSDNLSQRIKQAKESLKDINDQEKKTIIVQDIKQLKTDLIGFKAFLGQSKQDIATYAVIIRDPTNIIEALDLASQLEAFIKDIEEIENEIDTTSSAISNFIISVEISMSGVCGNGICEQGENANNCPRDCQSIEIKVETICTDGLDNDADGLVDNEDGDCWIREGIIYETHPYYYPNHSFKEITKQIPKLKNLGVKTILMEPIWEQPPGEEDHIFVFHIYDYYKLNPIYGTSQDLKELIDTAHKNDIKVLFELITCCTWEGTTLWNKDCLFRMSLSELQEKARDLGWILDYRVVDGDKYAFSNCIMKDRLLCDFAGMIIDDEVILNHYPSAGWGFAVDKTNPLATEYFTKVAEYYVEEYNIDGWRIDAPEDNWNPEVFSEDHTIFGMLDILKQESVMQKPDNIFQAERIAKSQWRPDITTEKTCEIAEEMLLPKLAYQYHSEFSTSKGFVNWVKEAIDNPYQRARKWHLERVNYRLSDLLESFKFPNGTRKPFVAVMSTLPGVPTVIAGQEIGEDNALIDRNPEVDWANGDYELRDFYKKVFDIRNNNNALKYGSIENVWKSGDNTYAYLREYEGEKIVIVINFQGNTATSYLDLSFLPEGTVLYDELNDEGFIVDSPSSFQITLPAYGSRVLTAIQEPNRIVFDTGESPSPYPSMPGSFIGEFTTNKDVAVTNIETYPCSGTGGKVDNWHFEGDTVYLRKGQSYKLYVTLKSYPQIFHQSEIENPEGVLQFISYTDSNGRTQTNWIPALTIHGEYVSPQVCGNGVCETGENGYNCPADCCVSGDGVCPSGCSTENDDDCGTGGGDLSEVKVASHYQRLTDGGVIGRNLDDVIEILKETHTDFVLQGWEKYELCPETCSDLSPEEQKACNLKGYSYEYLRNATSEIKKEIPDIIISGGKALEFLNPECWDEITGETFNKDQTWAMALDPSKWGIDVSKEEFQCEWAKRHHWIDVCDNPKEQLEFYFPDVTNSQFQELFLSWVKKQIDCGVDAYWIDMLYTGARELRDMTKNVNHPSVIESYNASSEIVDKIHEYGHSKEKDIYVVTWAESALFPFPQPDIDVAVVTVTPYEIYNMKMDEEKWDKTINTIKEKYGDIPIFARIDFGQDNSPLYVFSQILSKDQANNFLKTADDFLTKKGVIFIYPVHGGNMCLKPDSCSKLSYSKFNWYDSLAPEFQTYDTIKELAQKKASQ